ncbi:hypothetical protein EXT69_02895 [Pantoea agglomerans]|uniref:hypothetical protein n=1 Tax=Enterobacter agglomerans TaxID=549 RepID=UPI00202D3A1A|nr:hypothetical protein [Pantoea agglomerans]MCL6409894.1 hypothetical protein [Pantoea agglomerans]
MIDELKKPLEDIKDNFKSRLESPYWGFIFFSWLGFNWQNIARLLMSEKPVETRIIEITSQHLFFLHYWLAPVVLGVILAISTPYFQLLIGLAHSKAVQYKDNEIKALKKTERENINDLEIFQIDLEEKIISKRQESRVRQEMIESRKSTRLAFQAFRKRKFEVDIEALEADEHKLQLKISEAEKQKAIVDNALNFALSQQDLIVQKLNKIAGVYFDFEGLNNRDDFQKFMAVLDRTNALKIDDLSDEFRSMMEKEVISRNLRKE